MIGPGSDKNKKKIQFLPSPLICMNKAPCLVNRGWRRYLRLQPRCDDDDDDDNCDDDDSCDDDDDCNDDNDFNFHRARLL